jgi:hypothetical protein
LARDARNLDRKGLGSIDPGPGKAIAAGIEWLGRAQDCSRSRDGGVARHFSVTDGWSASYPETTGYIASTLIEYGRQTNASGPIERAKKMLDWFVAIQFPAGGFQGGMIDQLPRVPVTFNTGQILIGLSAGSYLDARYREAALKAADWLVSTQDLDGCWRRNPTPFAEPGEKTYETHVALGLFYAHDVEPGRGYLAAGLRQVDWALYNQAANGWLSKCCLSDPSNPLTHTLGYALRGIVGAYLSSHEPRYLQAACRTADGLLPAIGADGRLPGRLDSNWQAAADWVCLTGACQIAESMLLLHRATGRPEYSRAAKSVNSYVRRTIAFEGSIDMIGGVKGSFPIDGDYGRWQYLNWACKFMVDANMAEQSIT